MTQSALTTVTELAHAPRREALYSTLSSICRKLASNDSPVAKAAATINHLAKLSPDDQAVVINALRPTLPQATAAQPPAGGSIPTETQLAPTVPETGRQVDHTQPCA